MFKNTNTPQKALFIILCFLMLLMVFFSLGSAKNIGKQGFDKCIQAKCEEKGEAFCKKFREISNCCLGAGGKMTASGCEFL